MEHSTIGIPPIPHNGTQYHWNPTHSTKYHSAAMNKVEFGVVNLATLSPQHGLVVANTKLGQGPPSGTGTGAGAAPQGQLGAATGATGGDAYGAGVSQQAAV